MNSYWSSGDMKPTNEPMSLLTLDLKARSSGSHGRDLIANLETYLVSLLGAEDPLAYALLLQSDEPSNRQALEEFLEWTAIDGDFALIALVALSPQLERIASRLSWGSPSEDTVAEVLAQGTSALRWTNELVEGERVEFVLAQALSKTRSEQRRMARHNVPTTRLPVDYDEVEQEYLYDNLAVTFLRGAVEQSVISKDESELIERSRGDGVALNTIAADLGVTYETVKKRRHRAERKLRGYVVTSKVTP